MQISLASCSALSPELVFLVQICSIVLPIGVVAFLHSRLSGLRQNLQHYVMLLLPVPELDNPHFVSIAHIVRAILLAKVIATSIRGFCDVIRASHESSGMYLRPIQFNRDIAPIISNRRIQTTRTMQVDRHGPDDHQAERARSSRRVANTNDIFERSANIAICDRLRTRATSDRTGFREPERGGGTGQRHRSRRRASLSARTLL